MFTQSLILNICRRLPFVAAIIVLLSGLLAITGCATKPDLAAQQTSTLKNLGFTKIDEGWKLVLPDRVLFDFNKDNLKPELRHSISEVAHQLQSVEIRQLRVEGHTDNVGPREYNQALSLRRANSVAAVLVTEGFLPDNVNSIGHGMDMPTADNATEEGRAENRRVEIIVTTNVLSLP